MERNEAIDVVKKNWPDSSFTRLREALETLIPELKEDGDERIRKDIIEYFEHYSGGDDVSIKFPEWIAWLEKQGNHQKFRDSIQVNAKSTEVKTDPCIGCGRPYKTANCCNFPCDAKKAFEQKPADKVEPKFHKGEWCIDNEDGTIFQIVKVLDNTYTYKTNEGKEYSCTHYSLENDARLWTIQDAKDGDVLCYKDEISLYKHDIKNCTKQETIFGGFVYHCCYDGKRFITNSLYSLTEQNKTDIHLATKEQRNLLFQKIKEASYEWDAEKKELKKIEQKQEKQSELSDFESALFTAFSYAWQQYLFGEEVNAAQWAKEHSKELLDTAKKELCKQKLAEWSEEDEEALEVAIIALEDMYSEDSPLDCYAGHYMPFDRAAKQLKAIKDRVVPQPNQEWSEEDKEFINDLIGIFDGQQYQAHSDEEIVKWLKSIRLPYNKEWDENDEEMLKSIIATCELACEDRDSSPARHLLQMQTYWLKSLKDRYNWKPSKGQIEALEYHINHNLIDKGGVFGSKVVELLNQLKEL